MQLQLNHCLCHPPCFSYEKVGWFCVQLVYKFLVSSFSYEKLVRETWTVCHRLYRSSRLGLSHWDPYAVRRGSYLELYGIIVTRWSGAGGIQALSARPTGFLHCFDTVGLVISPVKIVPDMTYNVFGRTLNLAQSQCQHPTTMPFPLPLNCPLQLSFY